MRSLATEHGEDVAEFFELFHISRLGALLAQKVIFWVMFRSALPSVVPF